MIYQPAFEVPAEIAVKVAAGEYVLWGGVVRDTAGRIVKLLKPVELQKTSEAALSVGQKIIQFAKANPAVVVIGAVTIAAAGTYAFVKFSDSHKQTAEINTSGLNRAMLTYIQALQDGSISITVVDDLLEEIEELESITESGTVMIEFSSDQLKQLVSSVHEYTVKFVEDNAQALTDVDVSIPSANSDVLTDLKSCLQAQKLVLLAA